MRYDLVQYAWFVAWLIKKKVDREKHVYQSWFRDSLLPRGIIFRSPSYFGIEPDHKEDVVA